MKLRKLLSGVTAAIMAISSVAVASFTSVSATSDFDPYATIWYQGNMPVDQVIAQGNATAEMAGATKAKVYVDMGPGVDWNGATNLNLNYQVGYTTNAAVSISGNNTTILTKQTDYTGVHAFELAFTSEMAENDGYFIGGSTKNWATHTSQDNYIFGILWVEFIDKEGNVLYTQKEVGEEPEFGTPPNDKLPIRFVNNEGADLCDPLEITADGTYEMTVTGLNLSKSSTDGYYSFGLYNSYAAQVIDPGTTITLEKLTFNDDVDIEITDAWKNRSAFEGAALKYYPINHWGGGDQLDKNIPDGTVINKIYIKFTINGCKFGEAKDPVLKGEKITKVTYDYTVTDPGTAKFIRWDLSFDSGYPTFFTPTPINGAGDYTTEVEVTGSNTQFGSLGAYIDATANETDVTVDNVTQTKDTAITLKSITFNDTYKFDTGNLELNNKVEYQNGLANIWNDEGAKKVIYQNDEAYIAGTNGVKANGIKLVKGTPPADEPENPENPENPIEPAPGLKDSYDAFLMFANENVPIWENWNPVSAGGKGIDAEVKGSGTYTVGVDNQCYITAYGDEAARPEGFTVFNVDIRNLATDIGAKSKKGMSQAETEELARKAGLTITDVSILVDGSEVYKFNDDDVMFGDIEANGNIRLEIFNLYGESKTTAPDEIQALAGGGLELQDKLEVTFTLNYTAPATPENPDKPNNPGNNTGNNNGGSTVKPGTPANKGTTVAPKSNAKSNAKKIVNKAKIKNIKAKAKGKKVTITWKKASKVTGYNIQVATKKNFKKKSIVAKKTLKKNAKKVTLKIKKLKKGKTYWVRVQAYKTYKANGKTNKVTGSWKKFKFKA